MRKDPSEPSKESKMRQWLVHMNTQVLEVHYLNVRALDIHGHVCLGGWTEANLKLLGLVCVEQQVVHTLQCLSHWRTSAGDKG